MLKAARKQTLLLDGLIGCLSLQRPYFSMVKYSLFFMTSLVLCKVSMIHLYYMQELRLHYLVSKNSDPLYCPVQGILVLVQM